MVVGFSDFAQQRQPLRHPAGVVGPIGGWLKIDVLHQRGLERCSNLHSGLIAYRIICVDQLVPHPNQFVITRVPALDIQLCSGLPVGLKCYSLLFLSEYRVAALQNPAGPIDADALAEAFVHLPRRERAQHVALDKLAKFTTVSCQPLDYLASGSRHREFLLYSDHELSLQLQYDFSSIEHCERSRIGKVTTPAGQMCPPLLQINDRRKES